MWQKPMSAFTIEAVVVRYSIPPSAQERSAIMKSSNHNTRCGWWFPAFVLALALTACGGDGNDNDGVTPPPATGTVSEAPPETARTVIGAVDTGAATAQAQAVAPGTVMTLDDGTTPVPLGPEGQFEIHDLSDGNHSLFLLQADGTVVEIPFRMLEGRSLSLGTVQVRDGVFQHSGFNGFRFGFVDADNDGINDLFVDDNGDGICDNTGLYAGYPYFMGHGWVDDNNDGINDRFRDADGDGSNDVAGGLAGPGFGFLDDNGDGIADDTGMPFRHPFGFVDANSDGINDRFRDANGDGVNDVTGVPFIGMPGWVDLDGDGFCDFFTDANGDGINDRTGIPYGHGFGWADAEGDRLNDRFRDRDGDGINDLPQGPLAGLSSHYGFAQPRVDADGDGLEDTTDLPFHHGFGWVDADGDGVNDAFIDANGDGINDRTGHRYTEGFVIGPDGRRGTPFEWPHMPFQGGDYGPPATALTMAGNLFVDGAPPTGPLSLDDGATQVNADGQGRFQFNNLTDGNHSLFVETDDGIVEIPFRMVEGRSLNLGNVGIANGRLLVRSGFDGYRFGFVDGDEDGRNDLCQDDDGNGICDQGTLYADYPFLMPHGFTDANGDQINDRFRDSDGDGLNDGDGASFGPGFGFVDANNDGLNDRFRDADGDGICDLTGMPYRHPFGFVDDNNDGFNDRFRDTDGDGLNDITGAPYIGMPGWADLVGDGSNDFFRDDNGDGLNDVTGVPFGHGLGWIDIDGNGINDRFQDAQGDGVNDVAQGPFAGLPFHIGFARGHVDADGNGIDDATGLPYHHGFGWVDLNNDGINDAFADVDGDGVNDITGHHYEEGFVPGPGGTQGGHMDPGDWPMGSGSGGGMM
jgi:hypothetical protein